MEKRTYNRDVPPEALIKTLAQQRRDAQLEVIEWKEHCNRLRKENEVLKEWIKDHKKDRKVEVAAPSTAKQISRLANSLTSLLGQIKLKGSTIAEVIMQMQKLEELIKSSDIQSLLEIINNSKEQQEQ